MNIFSKLWSLFAGKKPEPKSPAFPLPITNPSLSRPRHYLDWEGHCFGLSPGQRFDSLVERCGLQEFGEDIPPIMLYTLRRDIPGHPAGSTVTREAVDSVVRFLERGGHLPPERRALK